MAFVVVLAAGCSAAHDPRQIAESMTKAVYANDLSGTAAYFDDETKKTVTREEVGALSDRMHSLGSLQGLAQRDSEPDKGRYEFDATFDRGKMLVQLRLDPSGKVGAYRIVPVSAPARTAAS